MPTDRRRGFCRRTVIVVALIAQTALGSAPLVANAAPLTPRSSGQVDSAAPDADVIPDQYIVLLAPGADARAEAEDARTRHGVNVMQVYEYGLRGFAFHGSAHAAEQLRRSGRAEAVSPDRMVHAAVQILPTGVQRVGANLNPIAGIDGIDTRIPVNVAMLDTGIDATHPDLQVAGGTNCIPDFNSALTDLNGHGTATAGVVGALDNSIGVVGVAPGVRLWSVRVLDANGAGTGASLVCGIDWITGTRTDADPTNDIAVVNASVVGAGGDTSPCGPLTTDAVHLAICRSVAKGVVYVAGAGNSAADARRFFPASYPEVITVAAMTDYNGAAGEGAAATCRPGQDDTFADYSNWGPAVDIVAPGTCILSTAPGGGTVVLTGTSMAAPHVTGAAALYVAVHGMATDQAGVNAIHQALTTPAGGWAVRQLDAQGYSAPNPADPCRAPMLYLGPAPTVRVHDVSISTLIGPPSVMSGDPATFNVGVSNDGDFAEAVSVTTTDNSTGATLDQRSVSLAAAGCTTYPVTLSTVGAPAGSRTITARATPVVGETATADNTRTTTLTITAQPVVVHVAVLSPTATVNASGAMNGIATVSMASTSGATPNVQVSGSFSNADKFSVAATCVTDASGTCSMQSGYIATSSMTFSIADVSAAPGGAALTYDPAANVATSISIRHS